MYVCVCECVCVCVCVCVCNKYRHTSGRNGYGLHGVHLAQVHLPERVGVIVTSVDAVCRIRSSFVAIYRHFAVSIASIEVRGLIARLAMSNFVCKQNHNSTDQTQ
jgi:hypothetical protein